MTASHSGEEEHINREDGNSRTVGLVILKTLLQIGVTSGDKVVQLENYWNQGVYKS